MLVLSRGKNEVITIGAHDRDVTIPAGQPIRIAVIEIRSADKVRLGIDAPKEIPVHRKEVYDAIVKAEEEAKGEAKEAGEGGEEGEKESESRSAA